MNEYKLETLYEIWNDKTGECVEVGLDRDGLDIVEVRQKDNEGKIEARMSFMPEQSALVAEAILKIVANLKAEE
jgi:hypothetical protein